MEVLEWSHLDRQCVRVGGEYIQSRRDMELVLLVKVNVRSVGWEDRQRSWRLKALRNSWRACTAALESGWVGAQSVGSSVMLKSPRRKSGGGMACVVQASLRVVQNVGCSDGVLGAYMLMAEVLSPLCHVIEICIARPGMRTIEVVASRCTISLFMTMATPAELLGRSGSGEERTWSHFAKRESICLAC